MYMYVHLYTVRRLADFLALPSYQDVGMTEAYVNVIRIFRRYEWNASNSGVFQLMHKRGDHFLASKVHALN
jgi:hypothetical protein